MNQEIQQSFTIDAVFENFINVFFLKLFFI